MHGGVLTHYKFHSPWMGTRDPTDAALKTGDYATKLRSRMAEHVLARGPQQTSAHLLVGMTTPNPLRLLLYDPQTADRLLLSVEKNDAA
jgi:hypothetical protein